MRRLIVGALVAGLLAACGSPSTDVAIAPPPSPNAYLSSVVITRSWASALVDATYRVAVDGQTESGTGSGQVGLANGRGRITWSGPDGERQELANDRGLFVRTGSGQWSRADGPTSTSGLIDVLAGLGTVRDSTASTGPDGLIRRSAQVAVTEESLTSFPLAEQVRDRVLGDPDSTITVTTTVNANGQIVAIDRQLSAVGVDATTSVLLSEFGGMLDLAAPTLARS